MQPRKPTSTVNILAICFGVVSLGIFTCCGGMLFITWQNSEEAKKDLTEANQQWDTGQRADAVAKYKAVLNRNLKDVPGSSERPTVYQRVIDFELEQGNTVSAKEYVEKAIDTDIDLSKGSKATNDLVTQVRVDRERKAAEEQAKRDAEEKRKQEEREVAAKEKEKERDAEEKRRQEEREAKAKRDEEELEVNGLVLLRKTEVGSTNVLGCEITGTVVNRTGKKLKYAQIQYNLYDASGAQIGSALANINGLEPGGRWNFKAIGVGKGVKTFKFSEMSGF